MQFKQVKTQIVNNLMEISVLIAIKDIWHWEDLVFNKILSVKKWTETMAIAKAVGKVIPSSMETVKFNNK